MGKGCRVPLEQFCKYRTTEVRRLGFSFTSLTSLTSFISWTSKGFYDE